MNENLKICGLFFCVLVVGVLSLSYQFHLMVSRNDARWLNKTVYVPSIGGNGYIKGTVFDWDLHDHTVFLSVRLSNNKVIEVSENQVQVEK